jgi:N-terminal domain of toast_rack, DUF2154
MTRTCAPLLVALLCLSGCIVEKAGPVEHDYRTIERDSTESLHASLNMGAGNLRIGSGTEKLVRADFEYNVPAWKPELRYTNGELTISQPSTHSAHFGDTHYQWDVRLNREVPLDLNINFGAGDAHLDLGSLALRRVQVDMGVGSIQMDLRGAPKHDYDVGIHGGVGECTVQLPSDVGVYAEASGGLGEIRASGLQHEGSHYFNDAYGKSKITVRLNIQGGVGSIRLISD